MAMQRKVFGGLVAAVLTGAIWADAEEAANHEPELPPSEMAFSAVWDEIRQTSKENRDYPAALEKLAAHVREYPGSSAAFANIGAVQRWHNEGLIDDEQLTEFRETFEAGMPGFRAYNEVGALLAEGWDSYDDDIYVEVVERCRKFLGPKYEGTYVGFHCLHRMAEVYARLGQWQEVETMTARFYEQYPMSFELGTPDIRHSGVVQEKMALLHGKAAEQLGKPRTALARYDFSVQQATGKSSRLFLCKLFKAGARSAEAAGEYEKARRRQLALAEAAKGAERRRALTKVAYLYLEEGRSDAAEAHLRSLVDSSDAALRERAATMLEVFKTQ